MREQLREATNSRGQLPAWLASADSSNAHLSDLLNFASTNYGRHTDWFLRHRDAGIRNLGALLAAEFAISSLHFTNARVPVAIAAPVLLFLALLALPLAWSAVRSCRSSYVAALESVLLVTKTVWAMGLTTNVEVNIANVNAACCPVPRHPYLYVPRYLDDATKHSTTEEFIRTQLTGRSNTYFWALFTIALFCAGAFATGVLTAAVMLFLA